MSNASMCGVVLWSSAEENKAVIWCEDHGNLAFYAPGNDTMHDDVSLDPGDLIEFDVEDATQHRRARNPRLLVENAAPMIASNLHKSARNGAATEFSPKTGSESTRTSQKTTHTTPQSGNVVAFPPIGTSRQELRLKAV